MQYSMLPGSEMNAYRIEHAPQFDFIAMITQCVSLSGIVFVLFHRWLAGFLIYAISTIAMILVPIYFVRIDILIQWENALLIAGIPFVISVIFAFSSKKIKRKIVLLK
jgi:phosphoglycerol transferase MdoB-like AlkP superfamily enzyme